MHWACDVFVVVFDFLGAMCQVIKSKRVVKKITSSVWQCPHFQLLATRTLHIWNESAPRLPKIQEKCAQLLGIEKNKSELGALLDHFPNSIAGSLFGTCG